MQINTDNIAQQCLNAINDRIHNLILPILDWVDQ